jgi:hypothetical protein
MADTEHNPTRNAAVEALVHHIADGDVLPSEYCTQAELDVANGDFARPDRTAVIDASPHDNSIRQCRYVAHGLGEVCFGQVYNGNDGAEMIGASNLSGGCLRRAEVALQLAGLTEALNE